MIGEEGGLVPAGPKDGGIPDAIVGGRFKLAVEGAVTVWSLKCPLSRL
jgi:hypothetical protein